jgi:hypothetical protein
MKSSGRVPRKFAIDGESRDYAEEGTVKGLLGMSPPKRSELQKKVCSFISMSHPSFSPSSTKDGAASAICGSLQPAQHLS